MRIRLAAWLRTRVKRVVSRHLARMMDPSTVLQNPYISAKLLPLEASRPYAVIRRAVPRGISDSGAGFPIPPVELWEGYGVSPEDYLHYGKEHVDTMLRILQEAGAAAETITTVLDFGCAAGRMIRFLPFDAGRSEFWGVDIKASHITWCQQHLSPPFRFAVTTTLPHLPFEDNYFDLVYCGSVFTHISDLADAWFLELRRVLKVGGHAYITVHDRHMIDLLLTKYAEQPGFKPLADTVRAVDADTKFLTSEFAYVAVGTEPRTQVFYDIRYLVEKWSRLATVVSVTEEAYGYQTALLLRKEKRRD